ncbi:oxidoreductase, partial [mine drainage metagenome]
GYHGEDEESFERTVKMLEEAQPEIINITRFSPRPYTPDYNRKTPPTNSVKRWTAEITRLHHEIAEERMQKHVGTIKKIFITEHGKNGSSMGRDQAYRPVAIPGVHDIYTLVDCEIVDATYAYAIGKIV